MEKDNTTIQKPIDRLRLFVEWARRESLCSSENDFERQCGLCYKYIANNKATGKGNIGTEMLGRIIRVYPQLNLPWLCTGAGPMTNTGADAINMDYKQAYEGAMAQIAALNNIIRKLEGG